ncbi:efflux RND transporter periplasmic adaptor subunit [Allorhizobium sp. NPDC080224]|uniref:Acriflavin resistance protein n=2 Tax=Alphaproteobacteria TaxID=28211 RepID=A0A512HKP3_9HYPH|nr:MULTISPECIES: efflux RND transporter periplasmic adaptor subunit [Alphaproteobacteria]NTE55341.1 efflux RND transporter periplasmic adaptor subunit [Agrobacterium tumefaciens]NTE72755.1 efflux RND transporter periplasmic adaptor subunit [Agrobacterium tumefaciens]GEO86015.1 acriflavin resistance protein [Ciceribacter naphthalenivorans]GLR23522.1 acriflavin resistance protein [Ciceribacter naphthalenivorans]GLT06378.1 acriflavin resistance protein [Sphingomonas psychrolutea]
MSRSLHTASILAVLLLLSGCDDHGAEQNSKAADPVDATVDTVELKDIPINYTVPGSVISDGRVEVSSRVVGFIEQLDVREGQRVKRGDLLVRIDPTDIDEAIRQARALVIAAEEDLSDAETDVRKYTGLAESGSVASETLRKAKVRADIARTTLDRAKSALAAAEAQKDYATITSPVDGVIVSVARRSGEMATAGASILVVESHEVLLFKAYLSEQSLASISTETAVAVRIDALGGREFAGRIRGIVPSGDDVTRRYEINALLPDDAALVPGMFGRADIRLGTYQAPVVPRDSITKRGGLDGVFVVENGTARFRWLRTGRELNGVVEVVSGLKGGEKIVAEVDGGLPDGARMKTADAVR